MKIPKRFELAGNTWWVKIVPADAVSHNYGKCALHSRTIYINEEETPEQKRQTFIHELGHAICATMGYQDHDEQIIEGVAQLVYQFMITKRGKHDVDSD